MLMYILLRVLTRLAFEVTRKQETPQVPRKNTGLQKWPLPAQSYPVNEEENSIYQLSIGIVVSIIF